MSAHFGTNWRIPVPPAGPPGDPWRLIRGSAPPPPAMVRSKMQDPVQPPKKKVRGASVDYLMCRAHLPEGPASLAELADWPAWVAKVLCSPHEHMPASRPDWQTRRDTMQTLLRFGLVLDTDFSGKGCAEVAMQCLLAGYEKIGMRVPKHALTFWRACDIDLVCQEILCEADSPVGAKHVFKDLLSRIPEQHQRAIQGLRPPAGAKAEVRAHAYAQQAAYLQEHRHACFSKDVPGMACLKHVGQRCPVTFVRDEHEASRSAVPPLHINISGAMCTPWTSFGSREGLSDPNTESWHLWSTQMQVEQPDIVTLENSPLMPKELFQGRMAETHLLRSICFGPEDLGRPERRQRLLSSAIKLSSLVWCGPDSEEETAALFEEFFFRRVVLEADVYAGLDPEGSQEAKYELFIKHPGVYGLAAKSAPLADVLLGDIKGRYEILRESAEHMQGFSGAFVGDLSQNPKERFRGGGWLPTATRSSRLVCFNKGDWVFSPKELNFSQGWPTIDGFCDAYKAAAPADFSRYGPSVNNALTGNGMHLLALSAWHAFLLSHVVRRDVRLPTLRPSSSAEVLEKEAEDESLESFCFGSASAACSSR